MCFPHHAFLLGHDPADAPVEHVTHGGPPEAAFDRDETDIPVGLPQRPIPAAPDPQCVRLEPGRGTQEHTKVLQTT